MPAFGITVTVTGDVGDGGAALRAVLDHYEQVALVEPLRNGAPPQGIESLFTAAAAARLSGPDRAALVEDGASGVGAVAQDQGTATVTPLRSPGGAIALVNAHVTIGLTLTTAGARLAIVRTGDLVLVPANGSWLIDSYDVSAKRDSLPTLAIAEPTTTKGNKP